MSENVVVLGASAKPDKYSYKAVKQLEAHGHSVFPVHPSGNWIDDTMCYKSLGDIGVKPDTITLYIGEANSTALIESIIAASPKRIIINPGAENPELEEKCEQAGINVQHACTLVLLSTNQF